MHLRTPLQLTLMLALLYGCGGEPASAGDTGKPASGKDRIGCDTFFKEFRDGILGHLRGTESLSLVSHVTAVSAATYSSGEPGSIPGSSCNMFGKSLRKARQPGAHPPIELAPACAAMIERIDQQCLQPLLRSGIPLSQDCNRNLIGFSATREDMQQRMGSGEFCD